MPKNKDVTQLPTDELQPNPFQPRAQIQREDLVELMISIKTYGILEPLVVAQTPAGYQIIAGERRWRAARELQLPTVPVVLKKTSPKQMLEMALVENVQRIDLDPIERAKAFQQLMRDYGYTRLELENQLGKSQSYISNSLRLLDLPDAIKDGLVGGLITEGHARALQGIQDPSDMIAAYKEVMRSAMSVRQTEEMVRRFKRKESSKQDTTQKKYVETDERVDKWMEDMQHVFSGRTKIKYRRSTRATRITFILKGKPEDTEDDLKKILKLAKVAKKK